MKRKISPKRRIEITTAYLMLLPDMLGLLLFVFIPILYALYVSFNNWNGLTDKIFIGFKNYSNLLSDEEFWISITNTFKYAVIYVPLLFCFSLMLALFVNSVKSKFQEVFRTIYFLPFSLSLVVAALVWNFLFDPMRGYVNDVLVRMGLPKQLFFASVDQALFSVMVVGMWLGVGYSMVILLSAIKDIPKEYFEAADIDGANFFAKFSRITLPSIKDASIFILVVTTIGSLQIFDQIRVTTNGGPGMATDVTVLYIYKQAFEINKIGYSSSIAFVLFIFILVLTMIQLKLFSENDNRKGGRKV